MQRRGFFSTRGERGEGRGGGGDENDDGKKTGESSFHRYQCETDRSIDLRSAIA